MRRLQHLLLLTLAGVAGAARAAVAAPWDAGSGAHPFPNPQRDTQACGRRGVMSFLCDPDGILSYDTANIVEGLIAQVQRGEAPYAKAACGAGLEGFQVAVALMKRMRMPSGESPSEAAAAFARRLHDNWGVGSSACNNGVLLLLSLRDRQMFISTGDTAAAAGLKGAALERVLRDMKPALRADRPGEAVLGAIHNIGLVLAGEEAPGGGEGEDESDGFGIFAFFAAVVASVWGWGWWSNKRQSHRFKTCQQKLDAIKRDQAALRRGQYRSTTCPICLEDFEVAEGDASSSVSGSGGASTSTAAAGSSGAKGGGGGSGGGKDPEAHVPGGESAPLLPDRSGNVAAAGPQRRPLVLRCGHSFCSSCISEWVKAHTTCPVCRRDIDAADGDEASPASTTPPPCGAQQRGDVGVGTVAAAVRRDFAMPELIFRTQRLGLLYPDFISNSMTAQWLDDITDNRDLSAAALARFEARHPARTRAEELRTAGAGGASVSFGGGHSSGGGGSSW